MAEEATTTTEATEAKSAENLPTTQADLDKIVESRLARERKHFADYDDLKAKAEKFDKTQEESKTEIQRAMERATKAEAEVAQVRMEADRNSVALTKGLTPTQAKRLVGATREELEADADELLKDLAVDGKKPPRARDQKQTETDPQDNPEREFARQLFKRTE